ncbi:MAG: hypothetical protein WC626_10795 [Methanoregula sp.]
MVFPGPEIEGDNTNTATVNPENSLHMPYGKPRKITLRKDAHRRTRWAEQVLAPVTGHGMESTRSSFSRRRETPGADIGKVPAKSLRRRMKSRRIPPTVGSYPKRSPPGLPI